MYILKALTDCIVFYLSKFRKNIKHAAHQLSKRNAYKKSLCDAAASEMRRRYFFEKLIFKLNWCWSSDKQFFSLFISCFQMSFILSSFRRLWIHSANIWGKIFFNPFGSVEGDEVLLIIYFILCWLESMKDINCLIFLDQVMTKC